MRRVQLTCLLGTGFEYFEFQLFALLMPIWVSHFFDVTQSVAARYLAGYLLLSVAFVARLLGAIGLGFMADKFGRRVALLTAMWLMAVSTGLIACLPEYALVGAWSTWLLLCCRLGQGLSLGGEFAIGGVLLFEQQTLPRCLSMVWQDLGGTGGLFLATLSVVLLQQLFTPSAVEAYVWRYPFCIAFFISLAIMAMRRSLPDKTWHAGDGYVRQLAGYSRSIGLLMCCCAPNGVFWYLQVVYIPNQLFSLSSSALMALIALSAVSIPLAASCADHCGLYRTWIISVLLLVVNFNLFILSSVWSLQVAGLVLQAFLLALNQGPRLLIINQHFPLRIRAQACCLVYSGANVLGGLMPFIALWLWAKTESNQALGGLLLSVSVVAVWAMHRVAGLTAATHDRLVEECHG